MSAVQKIILIVAGSIAAVMGAVILVAPHTLHHANGVELESNASLLSEIRSPGAALVALGILVIAGAFVPRLTRTATVAGAVVFFGYGIGRLVSIGIDGTPKPALVVAACVELAIGIVLVWTLRKYRSTKD